MGGRLGQMENGDMGTALLEPVSLSWKSPDTHSNEKGAGTWRSSSVDAFKTLSSREHSQEDGLSWRKLAGGGCFAVVILLTAAGVYHLADHPAERVSTPCEELHCSLHGGCKNNGDGSFRSCDCDTGWDGLSCERATGCDKTLLAAPCAQMGAHGLCTADGAQFSCSCKLGWQGEVCDQPTGCDNNPCGEHGTCAANGGSHNCTCTVGWDGDDCKRATGCDTNPDCGHGTCHPDGGEHSCAAAYRTSSGWALQTATAA